MKSSTIFTAKKAAGVYAGKKAAVSSPFTVGYKERVTLRLAAPEELLQHISMAVMVESDGVYSPVRCQPMGAPMSEEYKTSPIFLGKDLKGNYRDTIYLQEPGTYHLLFKNTEDLTLNEDQHIVVTAYGRD